MQPAKILNATFDHNYEILNSSPQTRDMMKKVMFYVPVDDTLSLVCQFVSFSKEEGYFPVDSEGRPTLINKYGEASSAPASLSYNDKGLQGSVTVDGFERQVNFAESDFHVIDAASDDEKAPWVQEVKDLFKGTPFKVMTLQDFIPPDMQNILQEPFPKRNLKKRPWAMFLLVPTVLVFLAMAVNTITIVLCYSRAAGEIVDIKVDTTGCSRVNCASFTPQIAYKDTQGTIHTFWGVNKEGATAEEVDMKVGDPRSVLYNPKNPTEARENDWRYLWLPVLGLGFICLFLWKVYRGRWVIDRQ